MVFLSMVATPEVVISQTKREIQQRLNVAMSRAQDRVYLVRSVAAENLKKRRPRLALRLHRWTSLMLCPRRLLRLISRSRKEAMSK